MKPCNQCKVLKPLNAYDGHPKYRDGHVGKCKACRNKDRQARKLKKVLTWFILD